MHAQCEGRKGMVGKKRVYIEGKNWRAERRQHLWEMPVTPWPWWTPSSSPRSGSGVCLALSVPNSHQGPHSKANWMCLGAEKKQEVTSGITLLSDWVPNSGGQGCIKVLTGSSLAACCCGSSVTQPSGGGNRGTPSNEPPIPWVWGRQSFACQLHQCPTHSTKTGCLGAKVSVTLGEKLCLSLVSSSAKWGQSQAHRTVSRGKEITSVSP